MLHHAYYLIEPKPELAEQVSLFSDKEFAQMLLEPVLLQNAEADRSTWREKEHLLRIKLLFIARLREYTPLQSDSSAITVLGSSSVSASLFDKWWFIRRLLLEDTAESLEAFLKPVLAKVELTENEAVDSWLSTVREKA